MALSEEMRLAIKLTAQDTTKQTFQGLNQSLDGLKRTALAVATAVGGALAFRDVIASTQRLGDEVDLLRDELGLSAEAASAWNVVGRVTGLTAQDISTTMGALNRKLIEQIPLMAEGKDDFTKWGVAVKDASGNLLSLEEVFENARGVINALPPGLARSGAAMDLFGRGGKQLIDFLTIGQEEMRGFLRQAREWGLILDDQGVDAIESFNRQMRFMDLQFDAIKLAIGQFLLPFLTRLLSAFRQGAGAAKAFGEALRAPLGIIKEVVERIGKFIAQVKEQGFLNAAVGLARELVAKVGEALGNVGSWIGENAPKWGEAIRDFFRFTLPTWTDEYDGWLRLGVAWVVGEFIPAFVGALYGIFLKLGEWSRAIAIWFVTEGGPAIARSAFALGTAIAQGIFDGLGVLGSRIGAWFNDNVLIPFQMKINELLAAARNLPLIGGLIPGGVPVNTPSNNAQLDPGKNRPGLAPGATTEEQRLWNSLGGGGGGLFSPMAHGGIVTRPTRALIGESGPEAVIPLGRGGGMGWNLTVNVSGNVTRSEKDLAEMVAGEIIRAMRGSGQPGGSPVSRGSYF